jgi:hypothetical protein
MKRLILKLISGLNRNGFAFEHNRTTGHTLAMFE